MAIAWDETLKVGDIEIDADHKELIGLINDFEAKAKAPDGVDKHAIQVTLERLHAEVIVHLRFFLLLRRNGHVAAGEGEQHG